MTVKEMKKVLDGLDPNTKLVYRNEDGLVIDFTLEDSSAKHLIKKKTKTRDKFSGNMKVVDTWCELGRDDNFSDGESVFII